MYRLLPCLAEFPTPAVNSDRGVKAAEDQKQHLAPLQQNIPQLVPVRTLSGKPSSAVRTLEKLLKALLVQVSHYSMKIKALPKWGFFSFLVGILFCFVLIFLMEVVAWYFAGSLLVFF